MVQTTQKIVAPKGQKQVGKIVSAKRETLVTATGNVSANENHIPLLLVFLHVNFHPRMLTAAPPCTVGAAVPSI